jgi:hypothetical protein
MNTRHQQSGINYLDPIVAKNSNPLIYGHLHKKPIPNFTQQTTQELRGISWFKTRAKVARGQIFSHHI